MRNFDELSKDLTSFVNLWDTIANEDISGNFWRKNKPLSYYRRVAKSTLAFLFETP
jgi:hypothetical protein